MLHRNNSIIKHKAGILNLAEELQNVSKACKITGEGYSGVLSEKDGEQRIDVFTEEAPSKYHLIHNCRPRLHKAIDSKLPASDPTNAVIACKNPLAA